MLAGEFVGPQPLVTTFPWKSHFWQVSVGPLIPHNHILTGLCWTLNPVITF
jgi:hypothetical protein